MGEESSNVDGTAIDDYGAVDSYDAAVDVEGLDQPEDEATEHALRLMDEALRRNDAGRRWLVTGDP